MPRKRPAYHCHDVRALAIEQILPKIQEWARSGNGDSDAVAITTDLTRAMSTDGDSYRIARNLERYGWECDFKLVEILEELDLFSAQETLVKAWVAAEQITLDLPIGTPVSITANGKPYSGVIVKRYESFAQYTVQVAELGHVGFEDGVLGIHGFVMDCENVQPINQDAK